MKLTTIIFLFLFASIRGLAQTTVNETTTLAIKYLEGEAGNYPNSLFITGIISEDDDQSIYGIKADALYDGCRGEVRVTIKDGNKFVILVKEFSTFEEARSDMYKMIAAERKYFLRMRAQIFNGANHPNNVEEKVYSDETHGTFLSMASIEKQPDADSDKQFKLVTKLTKQ